MKSSVYRNYDSVFMDGTDIGSLVSKVEFDGDTSDVYVTLTEPTDIGKVMRTHMSYHTITCTNIQLQVPCDITLRVEDTEWCGSNPLLLDPVAVLRFKLIAKPEFKENHNAV